MAILKKIGKYLRYLFRHKWFVFLGCLKYGLVWRGMAHDLSKFLPSELFPYMEYFYGKGDRKQEIHQPGEDPRFDLAWIRHHHRNPHHWQYWVVKDGESGAKCLPMPDKYRKEMLADWRGVKRALGVKNIDENAREWYLKYRSTILLHDDTRKWIEEELGIEK